jgi:hypothetical protein
MATEDALRARMKVVLQFGVTQRALADRLNVSESWLSRWLYPKPDQKARPINVQEMDRFEAYLREFAEAIRRETAQADDAVAGPTFHSDSGRKTGTDSC